MHHGNWNSSRWNYRRLEVTSPTEKSPETVTSGQEIRYYSEEGGKLITRRSARGGFKGTWKQGVTVLSIVLFLATYATQPFVQMAELQRKLLKPALLTTGLSQLCWLVSDRDRDEQCPALPVPVSGARAQGAASTAGATVTRMVTVLWPN